ncbi:hypothetical protein TNCV_3562721 [Trichonephila clavipes]|nr:hypothetical protein TNCV_3562721 [Trichonephila clavipes]
MLSERDGQVLKQIVTSKKRTTAAKVNTELYQHLNYPVSIITVRGHPHKQNLYGISAFPKSLVTDFNAKYFSQWCQTRETWPIGKWKEVICSDESSLSLSLSHFPYYRTGARLDDTCTSV